MDFMNMKVQSQNQKPQQSRRLLLLMNPQARQGTKNEEHINELLLCLRGHGIDATCQVTSTVDDCSKLAHEAAVAGYDIVAAAGGDGTIQSVVSGLVGTNTALGILPMGTMNNLARSLGIPLDVMEACDTLAMGIAHPIDVGYVNGHMFLEVVSIGIEASIITIGESARRKGPIEVIQAMISSLNVLNTSHIHRVTLILDGKRLQVRTRQITISNSAFYGLGLSMAPDASLDDGKLDVIITRQLHRHELIGYYLAIFLGKHPTDSHIDMYQARTIHVASRYPLPVAMDAQLIGETDITVTTKVAALRVIVPQHPASTAPEPPLQRVWDTLVTP